MNVKEKLELIDFGKQLYKEKPELHNAGPQIYPSVANQADENLLGISVVIADRMAQTESSNAAQHEAFKALYQDVENISGQKNISREKFTGQLDKYKQYDPLLPGWTQQVIIPMRENGWNEVANILPNQAELDAQQFARFGKGSVELSRLWLDAVPDLTEARLSAFGHSPLVKATTEAAQWALLFVGGTGLIKAAEKFPIAAGVFLKSPNWKNLLSLGKETGKAATAGAAVVTAGNDLVQHPGEGISLKDLAFLRPLSKVTRAVLSDKGFDLVNVVNTWTEFAKDFSDWFKGNDDAKNRPDPSTDSSRGSFDLPVVFFDRVDFFGDLGDWFEKKAHDWMDAARDWFDSHPDLFGAEHTPVDPIVIDLDGDGVKTLALAGKRHFDLDNNGFAEQTAWVDSTDGLLVRDLDGNGRIESGAELFGDHTALADGTRAADGYAALAEHDDNNDGLIDAKDPIWRELQVWRDDNGDAHSAAEELHPLADFDITAIALAPTEVDETDAAGNRISHRGTVRLSDESSRDAADVWFRVNTALSLYRGDGEVAPDIEALPDVRAFGNVVSLHIAMQRDAGLE